MILCRNIQPRRTLRWQGFPDVWLPVAPGDTFFVHESDFDLPGVSEAFDVMVLDP
jgi:hypothetical protein